MVVRLDPLEFDVDKVLRVERTGQDLFWLGLFWFAFEIIVVEKPTTQGTTDGQHVFCRRGFFGRGCFCRVEPGLTMSG